MSKPIILSIVSGKGGVGKTGSAVNISTGLSLEGNKTLLIDLDKQANATKHLNAYNPKSKSICELIVDRVEPSKIIKKTKVKNLDILPASYELEDVPDKILLDINRSRVLRLKSIEELK